MMKALFYIIKTLNDARNICNNNPIVAHIFIIEKWE